MCSMSTIALVPAAGKLAGAEPLSDCRKSERIAGRFDISLFIDDTSKSGVSPSDGLDAGDVREQRTENREQRAENREQRVENSEQ